MRPGFPEGSSSSPSAYSREIHSMQKKRILFRFRIIRTMLIFMQRILPRICAVNIGRSCALVLLAALVLFHSVAWTQVQQQPDPLPSWVDGANKSAILEFVRRVTTSGSPDFVPAADRVATFDNDGTLWPEEPFIEGEFVFSRLRDEAKKNPALASEQPYKAAVRWRSRILCARRRCGSWKSIFRGRDGDDRRCF